MTPVLPGYFGTVPDDFVAKHGGDAAVVPQGDWGAFKRPDWLDPRTTAFDEVSAAFYRAQSERFGDSTMYKMDLLHEGGNPGDVPVGEAAAAVEGALQKAHPGAIWAILGWQTNPSQALLDGVDKSPDADRRRPVRPLHHRHRPGERLGRHPVRLRQHLELRRSHPDRRQRPGLGGAVPQVA